MTETKAARDYRIAKQADESSAGFRKHAANMTAKHKPATAPVGCPHVSCEDVNRLIEEGNKARDDRVRLVAALRDIVTTLSIEHGLRPDYGWGETAHELDKLLAEIGE